MFEAPGIKIYLSAPYSKQSVRPNSAVVTVEDCVDVTEVVTVEVWDVDADENADEVTVVEPVDVNELLAVDVTDVAIVEETVVDRVLVNVLVMLLDKDVKTVDESVVLGEEIPHPVNDPS